MSAVDETPAQYIGGPLCGDSLSRTAPPLVRVLNPLVGGKGSTRRAQGGFTYQRDETSGDFRHTAVSG